MLALAARCGGLGPLYRLMRGWNVPTLYGYRAPEAIIEELAAKCRALEGRLASSEGGAAADVVVNALRGEVAAERAAREELRRLYETERERGDRLEGEVEELKRRLVMCGAKRRKAPPRACQANDGRDQSL